MMTVGSILPLIIDNSVRILDGDMSEICIIDQGYLSIVPSSALQDRAIDAIWADEETGFMTIRIK